MSAMHDVQHGQHVFECDCCDATFTANAEAFIDAWTEAKRDGWKNQKIGNDWIHGCPNCGVGTATFSRNSRGTMR
jgi:hypothetical protein